MKMFGHFVLTTFHSYCIALHITVGAQRFPTVLSNAALRAPTRVTDGQLFGGSLHQDLQRNVPQLASDNSLRLIKLCRLSWRS